MGRVDVQGRRLPAGSTGAPASRCKNTQAGELEQNWLRETEITGQKEEVEGRLGVSACLHVHHMHAVPEERGGLGSLQLV